VDSQAITRWAWIQSNLNRVSNEWLESEGLTWGHVRELKVNAMLQMTEESVQTEFGTVTKRPKGRVLYRKLSEVEREYTLQLQTERE